MGRGGVLRGQKLALILGKEWAIIGYNKFAIRRFPMTLAAQFPEVFQLPVAKRIELVGAIWDSIAEDAPIQLTEAQQRELDRRLDALESDPRPGKSWEQLKSELLSK